MDSVEPPPEKDAVRGWKGWFGTSWADENTVESVTALWTKLKIWAQKSDALWCCAQGEKCPTTGRYHLQWAAEWASRHRRSQLTTRMGKGRYECLRSQSEAIDYCSKEDTRVAGPWFYNCWRSDPLEPLVVLKKEDLWPWQLKLWNRISEPPDNRRVIWVYDQFGASGKSEMGSFITDTRPWDAVFIEGDYTSVAHVLRKHIEGAKKADDCIGIRKRNLRVVVFDYPRPTKGEHIHYTTIEKIKRGRILSGKYDSAPAAFNSPHVVVMSNMLPDWNAWTADRYEVYKLVNRDWMELVWGWAEPLHTASEALT